MKQSLVAVPIGSVAFLVALAFGWINQLLGGIHPRAALIPEALFPLCLVLAVMVGLRAPRQFVHDLRRSHGRIVGAFLLAFTPVLLGGLAWLTAVFVIDVVGTIATEDVIVTRTVPRARQMADAFVTLDGRRFDMVIGGRAPLGPARIHVGASGRVLHAAAVKPR